MSGWLLAFTSCAARPAEGVEGLPRGPFRRELAPGLVLSAYAPPEVPNLGYARPDPAAVAGVDDRLWVVRVDPARWEIGVWSALDPARGMRDAPVPTFASRFDLAVAFNPGMFEPDGHGSSHLRGGGFSPQPQARRNPMYRAWFVAGPGVDVLDLVPPAGDGMFGPLPTLPAAQVVSQSLPILRDGQPAYPPRDRVWSELCFGVDAEGWLVVVYTRYPYEMRELGARVVALGLGITDLVHGDGGPPATLTIRAGGIDETWVGSWESGIATDETVEPSPVPSVMGVRRR